MKVCFLAPELLPNQGGVGTYSVELLRAMAGRAEFTVLTPLRRKGSELFDRDRIEEYFGHRLEVHTISEANDTFVYNFAFQRAVRRYFREHLRSEGFDVVHSQHAHMPDLLTGQFRRRPPVVRTIHTTIRGQREGIRLARSLGGGLESSEKWQIALAPLLQAAEWSIFRRRNDRYIAVSDWMGAQLRSQGVAPGRVSVIHCGGDPSRFDPRFREEGRLRSRPDSRVVLFPGRPTLVKGSLVLAQALGEVVRRVPQADFVFTGAGADDFLRLVPFPPEVREHIRFLGYLPFDELARVYASADLVVAPSYYDNFPIRILEALASGVPVVATSVAGIPEIIVTGETGTLVPPGDPAALAKAIGDLLLADDVRRHLGLEGRRRIVDKFTWARAGEATLRLYAQTASTDATTSLT